MMFIKILLLLLIFIPSLCKSSGFDEIDSSQIRVLLGEIKAKGKDLEKIKMVSSRVIIDGSTYVGKIEIWKSTEGYYLINVVNLEDYVKGVVASEVGINWPLEALKSQAVLARTYAVAHILRNRNRNFYDVTSTVFHQVYNLDKITEEVEKAVRETEGEILIYKNEPIMAFYHACSVERTEDAKEVFGREYPYLKSVEVPFTPSPHNLWENKISFDLLEKILQMDSIKNVEIISFTSTGRVKELKFSNEKNSKTIKATELRRLLNWKILPSTSITNMKIEKDGVIFEGKGYGHGVGMCQWCAFQMALDGRNYKEILQYFYPGTKLVRMNGTN